MEEKKFVVELSKDEIDFLLLVLSIHVRGSVQRSRYEDANLAIGLHGKIRSCLPACDRISKNGGFEK